MSGPPTRTFEGYRVSSKGKSSRESSPPAASSHLSSKHLVSPGVEEATPWQALGASAVLHQVSVWTPPPELVQHTLVSLLELWVESPQDTHAILLTPRILPTNWNGLSKHLKEVVEIPCPPGWHPLGGHTPVTVLSLSPFVHSVSTRQEEVDRVRPTGHFAHRRAAAALRGM